MFKKKTEGRLYEKLHTLFLTPAQAHDALDRGQTQRTLSRRFVFCALSKEERGEEQLRGYKKNRERVLSDGWLTNKMVDCLCYCCLLGCLGVSGVARNERGDRGEKGGLFVWTRKVVFVCTSAGVERREWPSEATRLKIWFRARLWCAVRCPVWCNGRCNEHTNKNPVAW